ncbi:metallophosphoesterase [Gracilibacillus sp. YIM 98692]|uniref:metallophosphoesterase n=1 Tax=Gracilibacillus sp. YIM 98692 TaxID=2663532 RepID=UPI0013CFA345|nr:metallophosphoesterase [Gracilibacillus sp. YIM 98692]
MNRRTFLKKIIGGMVTLLGLSGGTYYYAKELEPSMLDIHRITINSSNIPEGFEGFTILQFSDTHIGFHYTVEQMKELVKTMNNLEADIVVFTGDLVDNPQSYEWDSRIGSLLSNIQAKSGKYWIYGNHDHGGYGTDILKETFDQSGFELLRNSHRLLKSNNDRIMLAGIDDVMLGNPDVEKAIQNGDTNLFTILLSHEPDYADLIKNFPVDVQLSGHSHGGQVQIPFLGYIYTPYLAEKYVEGHYQIGEKPLQLYVSRGIGTTRLPYRFFCKPEITLYQLSSKNK